MKQHNQLNVRPKTRGKIEVPDAVYEKLLQVLIKSAMNKGNSQYYGNVNRKNVSG